MDNDTIKLRAELISMIDALQLTVEKLEQRLQNLEANAEPASSKTNIVSAPTLVPEKSTESITVAPVQPVVDSAVAKTLADQTSATAAKIVNTTKSQANIRDSSTTTNAKATTKDSLVAITNLLLMLLGPFSSIFGQVLRVYQRYQKQGRGPAFLMTATGILALVMGFGFLLQYSFSNYLGIGGKIATGFISAIAIVVLGMRVSNKATLLSEFGAALIGLGIILNYLCAYFISGYFNIVGPTIGLGLLAAITFSAYWLSIHYDTKTVAILSLLGGASTPLFLGELGQVTTVYFIYLTFLVATMLHLAYKIKWPNLIQFTFIVFVAMTQYLLFDQATTSLLNNTTFIVLLHIIFYLFNFACLHQISHSESEVNKSILLTLVGNIIFFIFVLYQSINVDLYLGWTYLANAVILVAFYRFNWLLNVAKTKIKNDINALIILQIGILIGFGVLHLVSPALLGLIWGIEGLALVYVGFRFAMPSIRYEGHFAFVIGMSSAIYEAILWFSKGVTYNYGTSSAMSLSYDTGWMNLMVFGAVLWSAARLLQFYNTKSLAWEKKASLWSHELFSIWLSLAFMVSMFVVMSQELLLLSIVPLFILLYRARKYHLPITEYLGLAHYFLFAIQIFISAEQVNSFSFSQQNWIGITSRIEVFVTLWLIAEFYKRYYPTSKLANFAESLRITFYVLIPLLFIPKVIKSYDEFLPLALWLSAIIALLLFTRLKYKALKIEFYSLTILAWVVTVVAMTADYLNQWQVKSNLALFSGLTFFAISSFIWKAFIKEYQRPDNYKYEKPDSNTDLLYDKIKDYIHLHHWSVYYLATVIFIVTFGISENVALSFLISSFYFTGLCYFWPKILPAKNSLGLSYSLVATLCFFTLIVINASDFINNQDPLLPLYLIIQTSLLGLLLHKKTASSTIAEHYLGEHIIQLWVFNVFVIFVYASSIYFWIPEQLKIVLSILLVLHASILLMLTLKSEFSRLLKLSVILFVGAGIKILAFDMANFSLIQKIIAFMIIGALLLGASYLYQKMQQKYGIVKENNLADSNNERL